MFRDHADLVRVAEIEPQTTWIRATAPGALPRGNPLRLEALAGLPQAKLLHGVGNPVGGLEAERAYPAAEFRAWSRRLDAPWTSEHLAVLDVTDAAGERRSCGFLMPPLQTEAQVAQAAANIRARAASIGLPFAVETGVNYFAPRAGEMADGAFLAAVAEEADCGLLLDIANLWVNEANGRDRVADVLRHLPRERIWEVHLSRPERAHGAWLDAHAGVVPDDIMALAAEIVPELPNLGAIILEIAPDRAEALGEAAVLRGMERLHHLWHRAGTGAVPVSHVAQRGPDVLPGPAAWEAHIAAGLLPAPFRPGAPDFPATPDDTRAFSLYRTLVGAFRDGAISDLLEHSIRLLLLTIGDAALRALLDAYAAKTPPALFPTDEALAFADFLGARALDVPAMADLLAFETALLRAAADGTAVDVTLRHDITAVLASVAAGEVPATHAGSPYRITIGRAAA